MEWLAYLWIGVKRVLNGVRSAFWHRCKKVSDETLFITYGFTKLEGCLWSSSFLPDYGNYAHATT